MTPPNDVTPAGGRPSARIDRCATAVMFAGLVVAGTVAPLWSGLAVMVTDVCAYQDCPHEYRAIWGVWVCLAGVVLSLVAAVAGTARASKNRTRMWVWPTIGLLGVVGTWCAGLLVTTSAVH